MSTGTHFITGLVSLDFCEEYLKDKILILKNFLKKLGKDFKPSVQELMVQKSSFFHCEEYMKVKIMSRVLVGFGETTENRGRGYTRTEMDMDFLNVCYTRAPKGQTYNNMLFLNVDQNQSRCVAIRYMKDRSSEVLAN